MVDNTRKGVSLVVATLGDHDIRPLLNSLEVQSCEKYECIIIDQSEKRVIEPIIASYRNIKYLHSTRRGNSFNRNVGIKNAEMPIIAFPDDDCYYSPDVIEKVIHFFDAHPNIDGISGNWLNSETGELVIGGRPGAYVNAFNAWTSLTNITFFIRIEMVKKVNGYNEHFGLGSGVFEGGEESELMLQFLENGAKIIYTSEIRVWHYLDKSVLNTAKKHLDYEEAWGALFRKWSFSGRYRGVTFLTFLFLLLKSFIGSFYWFFRGNVKKASFYLMKNRYRLRGWFKYGNVF